MNRIFRAPNTPVRAAPPVKVKPPAPVIVSNAECPKCGGTLLFHPQHGVYCATLWCHGTGPYSLQLVLRRD